MSRRIPLPKPESFIRVPPRIPNNVRVSPRTPEQIKDDKIFAAIKKIVFPKMMTDTYIGRGNKKYILKNINGKLPQEVITSFTFWQGDSRFDTSELTSEQLGEGTGSRSTVKVLDDPRLIQDLKDLNLLAYLNKIPLRSIGDYRSFQTQEELFFSRYTLDKADKKPNTKAKTYKNKKWYLKKGKEACATPGKSNHGWRNINRLSNKNPRSF